MKIYDNDPEVYARTTNIKPERTKSEIDGVLARYGIKESMWRWDMKNDDVFLIFKVPIGKLKGSGLENASVRIEPHPIWHKRRGKDDVINWKATMRNMYWYVWTHLSQAYVNQSGAFHEFLPHILNQDGKKLGEVIKKEYEALPNYEVIENVENR